MGINGAFSAIGCSIILLVASNTQAMIRQGLSRSPLLLPSVRHRAGE